MRQPVADLAQAVRVAWKGHELNLIDTPGHVDFTYEVSRSLAACEGAVLLVDAAQGIEAQTLANLYLAMENDLTIIPVLNKIDLPAAQPEKFAAELAGLIGCDPQDVLRVSAKTGEGVEALLDEVVSRFDLARYPETRTIVREWMSGQPGGERTATRPDVATSVPAALALFAQGEEMLKRGERERALAKWHAAYLADPESFVVRKQIWRVLYPDRFGETIDLDWQRAQTAREKELGFAQANPSLPPPA